MKEAKSGKGSEPKTSKPPTENKKGKIASETIKESKKIAKIPDEKPTKRLINFFVAALPQIRSEIVQNVKSVLTKVPGLEKYFIQEKKKSPETSQKGEGGKGAKKATNQKLTEKGELPDKTKSKPRNKSSSSLNTKNDVEEQSVQKNVTEDDEKSLGKKGLLEPTKRAKKVLNSGAKEGGEVPIKEKDTPPKENIREKMKNAWKDKTAFDSAMELIMKMENMRKEQELRQQSKKQKTEEKKREVKEAEERENQEKLDRVKEEKKKKIQEKLEELKRQQEERAHIQKISNSVVGSILKSQPKEQPQPNSKEIALEKRKLQKNFELNSEFPELERKKKELAEKRKMEVSPADRKLLAEHSKNFQSTIKERTDNNKMLMEKRLKEFSTQYKEFKKDFKTKFTDIIIEEEKGKKLKIQQDKEGKSLKHDMVKKSKEFSVKVKDLFMPKSSVNKSLIDDSVDQSHFSTKDVKNNFESEENRRNISKNTTSKSAFTLRSNKNEGPLNGTKQKLLDANEIKANPKRGSEEMAIKDENTILEQNKQGLETLENQNMDVLNTSSPTQIIESTPPRKKGKHFALPAKKGLEVPEVQSKKLNYLDDVRSMRKAKEEKGAKFLNEHEAWNKHIKNKNMSSYEKFETVLTSAQILEEQAKRKEQLAHVKKKTEKNVDDEEKINHLYIDSIKAKLAILNMK